MTFPKLYKKVSWEFLFLTMKKLSIVKEFVEMVKLLFKDVKTSIYFNGNTIGWMHGIVAQYWQIKHSIKLHLVMLKWSSIITSLIK